MIRTKVNFVLPKNNARDTLITLEGTDNNLGAYIKFVEMQTNLAMTTEYVEHDRLASAKVGPYIYWDLPTIRESVEKVQWYWERFFLVKCIMLNRAYTKICQNSEKELKKLYIIERKCALLINFLNSRLAKVAAVFEMLSLMEKKDILQYY